MADTEFEFTATDGQRLFGRRTTTGRSGLPVLLLHGLSQQGHFWDPVIARSPLPMFTLDQRGHGRSDSDTRADYSIDQCARDISAALDYLGLDTVIAVGHSWGASTALRAAACDRRIARVGLIDGGLHRPHPDADISELRERLRPPVLNIAEAELWRRIQAGDLASVWSAEVQAALAPTFIANDDGTMRTRIGMERHMAVLDGLLAYNPTPDQRLVADRLWAIACTTSADVHGFHAQLPEGVRLQVWCQTVHDVPLQLPDEIAGWISSIAASIRS